MLLKGQTLALAAILGLAETLALVETLTLKETGSGGLSADSSFRRIVNPVVLRYFFIAPWFKIILP